MRYIIYAMDKIRAVELHAEVWQVKTMADGSVNLVLRLPEYCMPQAGELLQWHHELVRVVVELVDTDEQKRTS